jgi:choline dehydrogenase-like flavoprotein
MPQIIRKAPVFDVVVIGSGAGGGTAVKVLTDRGINVALLEAGPMLNPARDFREHVWPYQVDHRGAGAHSEFYFGASSGAFLPRR